jgi:hypothetical protein
MWLVRALLGNGSINTCDTHSQHWNEVAQPSSSQQLSKQTFARAQWRHNAKVLSRDLFSVLSVWRPYNEYLFKVKSECVESSGERKTIETLVQSAYKRR